jgi:hypothetical protein
MVAEPRMWHNREQKMYTITNKTTIFLWMMKLFSEHLNTPWAML